MIQTGQPGRWQHDLPAALFVALLVAAAFHALRLGGHHGDAAGLVLAAVAVWKGWDLVGLTQWALPLLLVLLAFLLWRDAGAAIAAHAQTAAGK
jgi:hypothetical protein